MAITKFEYVSKFPAVRLTHGNGNAEVVVLLHGATVLSWNVGGKNILFLSDKAVFEKEKAVRGGIPVVFPQFGPGKLPQHGFARTKTWKHDDHSDVNDKDTGDITTTFRLSDDDETIALWPYKFELVLTLCLKSESLNHQLTVINKSEKEFEFTALLHTYFSVKDVTKIKISGLNNYHYIDKVDKGKEKLETNESIEFPGEVDSVYKNGLDNNNQLTINDDGRTVSITANEGFSDAVIWNPGFEKSKASTDLGQHNYSKFVCVEAGHVVQPVKLDHTHQTWSASQTISINKM